jgi:signal transduction histidine kinase
VRACAFRKRDIELFSILLLRAFEHRRIDQAKDEFISLVSHELRNPLTVILGSVQTALTPGLADDEIRFLLENAAEGGRSMEQIITNLLELSRYQANRLNLARGKVNVETMAREAVEQVKLFHPFRSYSLNIGRGIPPVNADPVRVGRIIYNLVDNAAKYSAPDSEITVKIENEGKQIAVSVIDRGIGIKAERIGELFEPFQRLVEQSENTKGLGLGLVVCKRLVESHGGKLTIDSKEGNGSTFTFTLPLE